MEFITGALPNVMFIAGLIAIGLGLGIEFKLVEVKGELSKLGRIVAVGIGMTLIGVSVYLYTRPAQHATSAAPTPVVQPGGAQATANVQQAAPAHGEPTPTATLVATATPAVPAPTATQQASQTAVPTAIATVQVPDIRGQSSKDAQKALAAVGLQLGDSTARCQDIGAEATNKKLKRDQVLCQSPAPGSAVARDTTVVIVFADDSGKEGD